jgi:hypothetical protein
MNKNNTTTRRNLALAAIFMAAILAVGTFATTQSTQSAFAYSQKKKGDENSKNGNTITIQKCKQSATQSGFDNNQEQECANLICTHPGENATCVQERAAAAQAPPPVKLTCEQCFTKFLTSTQITRILNAVLGVATLEQFCTQILPTVSATELILILEEEFGVSESAAIQLVQCLLEAGIVFGTDRDTIRTLR